MAYRQHTKRLTETTAGTWYPLDHHLNPQSLRVGVRVSGTGSTLTEYDVEHAYVNTQEVTPVAGDIFAKAAKQTTSREITYDNQPIAAVRVGVTALATGGSVTYSYLQGQTLSDDANWNIHDYTLLPPTNGSVPSNRKYFNSSGLLADLAALGREWFWNASGVLIPVGLGCFEGITNGLTYSTDFSQWSGFFDRSTVQDQTDLEGVANNVYSLHDDDIDSSPSGFREGVAIANNNDTHTGFIISPKLGSAPSVYPRVALALSGGSTGVTARIVWNGYTGAIATNHDTGATGGILNLGDRWAIPMSVTNNTSGHTEVRLTINPTYTNTFQASSGVDSLTGSIGVVHGQIQPDSSVPGPIILTTGSSVSTGADDASEPYSGNGEGTVSGYAFPLILAASGEQTLWSRSDGTRNETIEVYFDGASGNAKARVRAGGVEQADITLGAMSAQTLHKWAFSVSAAGGIKGSLDAGAHDSGAIAQFPSGMNVDHPGRKGDGSDFFNGFVPSYRDNAQIYDGQSVERLAAQ